MSELGLPLPYLGQREDWILSMSTTQTKERIPVDNLQGTVEKVKGLEMETVGG